MIGEESTGFSVIKIWSLFRNAEQQEAALSRSGGDSLNLRQAAFVEEAIMTLIRPFILSAVAIAGSLSAYGNLVISNPAGTGAWYGPTLPRQGSGAFWDQTSQDGTNCNVGFWLQSNNWSNVASHCSSSTFSGSSGPDKALFFLAADAQIGGQGQAVGWTMNASGPQEQTVLRVEVAGNAGINTLGWYTISGGNAVNGGVIFTGSNSPNTTGSTISIAPGTQIRVLSVPGRLR